VRVKISIMQVRRVSLVTGHLTSVGYVRFGVIPNFRAQFTTEQEKEELTGVFEMLPGFEEIRQESVVYEGDDLSLFETDLAQLPLKDASPVVFCTPVGFAGNNSSLVRMQVHMSFECSGPR